VKSAAARRRRRVPAHRQALCERARAGAEAADRGQQHRRRLRQHRRRRGDRPRHRRHQHARRADRSDRGPDVRAAARGRAALPEAERFLRDGKWQRWDVDLLCGADVHGRTLGIVGLGRIGQAVARRARGFGMRVLYSAHDRRPADVAPNCRRTRCRSTSCCSRATSCRCTCRLRDETRHLIGVEQLCRMKRSAFLINTARGPMVDEAALVAALEEGLLAGAGLDVFEQTNRRCTRACSRCRTSCCCRTSAAPRRACAR
jgi:hypothetical protein